jgi:plasmid stabilization system protein ParE
MSQRFGPTSPATTLKRLHEYARRFENSCRRLARHPYIGHERDDLMTREDVRFWPVYSYLIIYRPSTRPLEILRVLHGKRDVKSVVG